MSEELKPCHCGAEAEQGMMGFDNFVGCTECGMTSIAQSRDVAIKAWNTRTPPEWKYKSYEQARMAKACKGYYHGEESFCAGFNAARELKEK